MAPGVPSGDAYQLTDSEAELLSGRLQGAKQANLGLAMSGGGLRSSLYNYGVLKALYDDGLLKDVDIISSVSGGSYLSYYLYTLHQSEPGRTFGSAAFDDAMFAERTCELVANANFVTYGNILRAAAKLPVRGRAPLLLMYENQIHNTYGFDNKSKPLSLHSIVPMVRDNNAPYLIINATTYGKHLKHVPWNRRTFEFTPLAYGSFGAGFSPWEQASGEFREYSLLSATAASGAAKAPLRRSFAAPFKESSPEDVVELWDGGMSENLGAAALLLRGTRDLIVVDAQYDGRGQMFEAYRTLQDRMDDLGIGFSLDRQPQFTAVDVYPGRVVGSTNSRVYYIKMSISPNFRAHVYSREGEDRLRAAEAFNDRYWDVLGKPVDGQWQCQRLKSLQTNNKEWLFYQAASYLRFAERDKLLAHVVRGDPPLIGTAVNHSFPRLTTVDQSFYLDQALAFIGLGYVTTKDQLKEMMRADHATPATAKERPSTKPHQAD
ncbi:hypothetical protein ABIE09_001179 [Lysobacter enzymogenes]|uniref:patatin-like phospholipase family protein n=1 Tax=Lysobacter enzymogenes TaxID=69 RepID=UPI003395B87B